MQRRNRLKASSPRPLRVYPSPRFTWRRGVKWHDGRDFTSEDVRFTLVEVLAKLHPRASAVFKNLGLEVETPDPGTVVIKLQKAYAPFLSQMTVFDAPMLPRHIYEGSPVATNPVNLRPVGTGRLSLQSGNAAPAFGWCATPLTGMATSLTWNN